MDPYHFPAHHQPPSVPNAPASTPVRLKRSHASIYQNDRGESRPHDGDSGGGGDVDMDVDEREGRPVHHSGSGNRPFSLPRAKRLRLSDNMSYKYQLWAEQQSHAARPVDVPLPVPFPLPLPPPSSGNDVGIAMDLNMGMDRLQLSSNGNTPTHQQGHHGQHDMMLGEGEGGGEGGEGGLDHLTHPQRFHQMTPAELRYRDRVEHQVREQLSRFKQQYSKACKGVHVAPCDDDK